MTFRELNDRNYFEVNAIHMEIMLPDTVALAIPENKPGAIYHLELVLQITNNTLYLCEYKLGQYILELCL